MASRRHAWRRARTPTVLQLEAVECGAAALGMVLGYHGRYVPLSTLRRDCGVSRDGSKASNIVRAARRYGLIARGFGKDLEALQAIAPPFIVFWSFNHFVVVEGMDGSRAYLNDPAVGHRTVGLSELDRGYTGVVLTFEPGPDFRRGGRPPSMRRGLRERLRGSGAAIGYSVLAGLLLVIPGITIPAAAQVFIDSVVIEAHADWLRPLILVMLAAVAAQAALKALQLRYLRRLRVRLTLRLASRFVWHLLRLPASFYAQRFAGEIANRALLSQRLAAALSGRVAQTIIDAVMAFVYAALLFYYDFPLATIAAAGVLGNLVLLRWLAERRIEANMGLLQAYGKAEGTAIAGLQGIETIKASGREDELFATWAGHYAKASNARQALELGTHALHTLPGLLGTTMTALVLVVGGLRIIEGHLTIGMLVAFQLLLASFMAPVNHLMLFGGLLQELRGDLARLDDVLAEPSLAEPAALGEGEAGRLKGFVEMRGVTFGYNPLEPPLVVDLDLRLRPGQRVALVGRSGSGKSTILRLISGELAPWAGEILYDGTPREQVPRETLVRSFAAVDQEIALFGGSLRDNLTLWDETTPEDELDHACADAEILDAVLARPGGYAAELLEGGANFSGGERQRLELARAMLNEPSVLILDEATSALDAETERLVIERLRARGCATLMVSHRLSAVRDSDEILVLEGGRVVERGTHETLSRQGGVYARLVASGGET